MNSNLINEIQWVRVRGLCCIILAGAREQQQQQQQTKTSASKESCNKNNIAQPTDIRRPEPQKAAPLEKAAKVEGLSKPTSEVSIDPNIKQALEAEHFDQSKVESIKAAIERGNYPLDDRKIAESFIPLEKLI